MFIKVLLIISMSIALIDCAKLLRTPKVYNAIITTDENLTPSRAFPVIQPAIPVLSPFFPTSVFNPYSRNGIDVNEGARELTKGKTDDVDQDEGQISNNSQIPPKSSNTPEEKPENEKSPIPLNEYGFPPSLIPLQKFPNYPYNYPFIFDSYGNFQTVQQYPVLPPSYYPQQEHQLPSYVEQPLFQVGARKLDQEPPKDENSPQNSDNSLPALSNNNIKNNANTNADVPDVEIPPFPFTIKKN